MKLHLHRFKSRSADELLSPSADYAESAEAGGLSLSMHFSPLDVWSGIQTSVGMPELPSLYPLIEASSVELLVTAFDIRSADFAHPHEPSGSSQKSLFSAAHSAVPTITFVADTAAAAPATELGLDQINSLIIGLTSSLTNLHSNVTAQIFAETLPIFGNNLVEPQVAGAAQLQYLATLKTALVDNGLGELSGPGPFTKTQVETAIASGLHSMQIGGLATLNLADGADITLNFATSKTNYALLEVPVDSSLGLSKLGLSTSGLAQSDFDYVLNFATGLDTGGFYVAAGPNQSFFSIKTNTLLGGLNPELTLSDLKYAASDQGSNFNGTFNVALNNPGGDGRLRTFAGDLITPTLTGVSDVKLHLTSDMEGAALPQLSTDLRVKWDFTFSNGTVDPVDDNGSFGFVPDVRFSNNLIDLGSFFHDFAAPVLETVSDVIGPFKPVLDALTERVDLLHRLGLPSTLLEFLGAPPRTQDIIEGLSQVVTLADLANDFSGGATTIDLGSFRVLGDVRADQLGTLQTAPTSSPGSAGSQNAYLGGFLNSAASLGGGDELSFPLLQSPGAIAGLLLGRENVELFVYDPAAIKPTPVEFQQFFPVLGPFGVTLGGSLGFEADFAFGFDTQGLKDFATSGSARDVFNGFFVRAFDDEGDPATFLSLNGGLSAGVAVNIVVAEAGVQGDLTFDVLFPFKSSKVIDGKVRGGTITDTANPFDLFAPAGEISAGLSAYLQIGFEPFAYEYSFEVARQTLYTFGQSGSSPVLVSEDADGSLRLNSGPRSALREEGNLNDGSERFEISSIEILGVPTIVVSAFRTQDFARALPGRSLVGNGGDFSDVLKTTPDFEMPVIFFGGSGGDTLISGEGDDLLDGGTGRDTLYGNAGADLLNGGEGDDVLHGGPGADTLSGGQGIDFASYATSLVGMTIDLRTQMLSGDGAGDTFSDIEGVIGSEFGDLIEGKDGDDVLLTGLGGDDSIYGNGGNDAIDGGAGVDSIYAGSGNDFVSIVQDGGDLLFGGDGTDTVSFLASTKAAVVYLHSPASSGNTILQFENIIGSLAFNAVGGGVGDNLEGDDGPNVIYGMNGGDFIYGHGGDDLIYGNFPAISGLYIFGDLPNPELGTELRSDRDYIRGYAGRDTIHGQADNDYIDGGTEDDELYGEEGDDTIYGSFGSDRIHGGPGNDSLYATDETLAESLGDDIIYGGDGNDLLDAGRGIGNYEFYGENDNDTLKGSIGNDRLDGGDGNDTLHGGAGNDMLDGGNGADSLEGGSGNNVMRGGTGDDYLGAFDGDDDMDGGEGDDTLDAQLGNNLLRGGSGNDTLLAAFGNDIIYGDDGNDRIDAGIGRNFLYGGAGDDTILASFNDDYMEGNEGNDLLNAQGGSNTLYGGAGLDTLLTSGGNDLLDGGDDSDLLDAGNGTDRLVGGAGNDVLIAGSLRQETRDTQLTDRLFGGSGFDTITADFSNQTTRMTIIIGADNSLQFADGAEALNFENVHDFASGSGDDLIQLNGELDDRFGNYLLTGAGNDMIFSGAGNDYVDAGEGDDFVNGGSNNTDLSFPDGTPAGTLGDTLVGGAGNDTISFADIVQFQNSRPLGVEVNLATNATGLGASGTIINGFENTIGTPYRDELIGNEGPNAFYPLRGGGYGRSGGNFDPDQIDGAGGEDTLIIDFSVADPANGLGVVTAGRGFYRNTSGNLANLDNYGYANIEHLDITGASKNDSIYSLTYGFSDVLRGLGGNDTLGGFGGADTLLGGDGNDVLTAQGTFQASFGGTAGGHDVLDGGAGDDFIDDIAIDGFGRHVALSPDALFKLDGGTGFDTLSVDFSNHLQAIVWNSSTPADLIFSDGSFARNFEQIQHFASGPGNDSFTQLGRVDNLFFTNAGNDMIAPGLGFDTVDGGDGDDILIVDYRIGDLPTSSGVSGGGVGTALFRNGPGGALLDYLVHTNVERFQITGGTKADNFAGGAGADFLAGKEGDDTLNGNAGDDFLDGGLGADVLRGGSGNDRYLVDSIADIVAENAGEGTDTIYAIISLTLGMNTENLELGGRATSGVGNTLANLITGNARSNVLSGGGGDDVLQGGFGTGLAGAAEIDRLTGGAGADTFVLGDAAQRFYDDRSSLTPGAGAYARIDDFTPTQGDRLRLKGTAPEYFLAPSGLAGVSGMGLFHDTDASGAFEPGRDELLAILESPAVLDLTNTINAADFV